MRLKHRQRLGCVISITVIKRDTQRSRWQLSRIHQIQCIIQRQDVEAVVEHAYESIEPGSIRLTR